jgi:hypothetical protein
MTFQRRADVVINYRDREAGDRDHDRATEWVHEEELDMDEFGVTLRWDSATKVFLPWNAVLRIDYSPCHCFDCERAGRTT